MLAIAKYPSLSQPASTALQELGGAIETNATPAEISAFLRSMMAEEVQVRHACLQALTVGLAVHDISAELSRTFQQPLDLTDLDYTPELWIVCQDSDERNADLASTIWEDNGLDIKENAIDTLAVYLGERYSRCLALDPAKATLRSQIRFRPRVGSIGYRKGRRASPIACQRSAKAPCPRLQRSRQRAPAGIRPLWHAHRSFSSPRRSLAGSKRTCRSPPTSRALLRV